MKAIFRASILAWIILLGVLPAGEALAATRVLDRIEVDSESDDYAISVYFNVPVRYVSHLSNEANNEVGVQLQIMPTQNGGSGSRIDIADLVEHDQLTWSPTRDIPLNKVVFQRVPLGTSNLLVSFATPVENFRIRQNRDFYVLDFLLKKQSPSTDTLPTPASMVNVDVPQTAPPLTARLLTLVIYVINLDTQKDPIDLTQVAPVAVEGNQALYTTVTQTNGKERQQLRLGYFRTRQEAEHKLKEVKELYPDAWIDEASLQERRDAMFKLGITSLSEIAQETPATVIAPADERLTKMMDLIRRTLTAGEFAKAVRMLEAFLSEPENYYTKEAMELLGLARERNGQKAHAKADYEAFIAKYPEGDDTQRVKQRLLGLITATQPLREPLEEKEEKPTEWTTYGSFSQYYRRDEINSPLVDADKSVSRSEIDHYVSLYSHYRGQEVDLQMAMSGGYALDLLNNDTSENEDRLSELYVDMAHRESRTSLRLGRQRQRSSGLLNRFDGLVLGYELTSDIRLRAAAGLPVESSRDVSLNEHKKFAGLSGDISNILENWDLSLYLVDQRVDSLIDRRSVGGELRYFDAEKSLFSLLDYDIHFGALNIFTVQGNWNLQDQARVYMNFDYRKSPLLQTSTALNGYNNPDLYDLNPAQVERVESIDELLAFESESSIYQRAEEITADTTTLSLGANYALSDTLQISGDFSVTRSGDTLQQGEENEPDPNNPGGTRISHDYFAAQEATDNQYFYSLQLIKNSLLKQGDIGILSMNYYDTSTSSTLRLGASSRYPVSDIFRLNPSFTVSYRNSDLNNDTRLSFGPHLRMDYRLKKGFTLEFDGGINWYREKTDLSDTNYSDYYLQAGYRWDF